jgi:cell division protein FtsA
MSLTDDERRLGCMFVDFGAETTTVSIYKNGAPIYLVTLPMGSRNITLDLTALNYIEERAEEIKRISGNAMPQEGVRRQGADGIDYTEVNNFVHARAAEIVQNILAQIEYAGMKAVDLPGGIVIVGGGASLRGFNDLLSKQGKMKVRMGSVQGPIRISDNSLHPSEMLDVISILLAASKLPEAECIEFPLDEEEETSNAGIGSYEDMEDDNEDESQSRIGRGYDDDADSPARRDDKKKIKKTKTPAPTDEEEETEINNPSNSRRSIFHSIKERLSTIFSDDPDDSFT